MDREKERSFRAAPHGQFSYLTGGVLATPWEAAFPSDRPLGYWEVFVKRSSKLTTDGLIEENVAKEVWLSILNDYEDYEKHGMWIPSEVLEEHRKVAKALGWI